MIAPGSGLAVLIASLVVSAHDPLGKSAVSTFREPRLAIVPVHLDGEAREAWRSAIANDDGRALELMLGHHPHGGLVGTRAANGKSALMVACKLGDLALAKALVAAGADPDETSATGGTPFMFAVLGDRLPVARWLHARGAAVDARGSNGWSATTIAAAKGLDGMLAWLLDEADAPADVADLYGFTPLMRSVDNAHERTARRLLDAGARVDAADESGNTALHHAVAGGHASLVELLLDRGADPRQANRDGVSAASLVSRPADTAADAGVRPESRLPPATIARLERAPAGGERDDAERPDGSERR